RQGGERTTSRPGIVRFGDRQRTPPDRLRHSVSLSRPRHPAREEQRANGGPGTVEALRGSKRPVEEPLRLVHVRLDVYRDVTEKAEGQGQREGVVTSLAEGYGPIQRLSRRRILPQPVACLAHPGQRPGLPDPPVLLGPAQGE